MVAFIAPEVARFNRAHLDAALLDLVAALFSRHREVASVEGCLVRELLKIVMAAPLEEDDVVL